VSKKTFSKNLKSFGYGLVRLSSDFKIIDKNIAAENHYIFPKRNSKILDICKFGKESLLGISDKTGDNAVVWLSDGVKTLTVLAIREDGESILLLLHPLVSRIALSLNKERKLPRAYAMRILEIIYGLPVKSPVSAKELFPFTDISSKSKVLLGDALVRTKEKLQNINFKNKISFDFDEKNIKTLKCLDFSLFVYAVSEILAVENTFSDGQGSKITFSVSETSVDITLKSSVKAKADDSTYIYGRLFSEIFKRDVQCKRHDTYRIWRSW
jgi:hypothetical protein